MSIAKRLIEEELNKKSQAEIDKDELDELDEIYWSKIRSRKDEVDKDELDGAEVKIRASEIWWAEACVRMEDLIKSSIQRDDLSSKEKIELLAAWERIKRG